MIVFVGDLHACTALYQSHPTMTGDTDYAAAQIGEFCRKYGAKLVLVGDVFNSRFPEARVIRSVFNAFAGVDGAFLQAQHDWQRDVGWMQLQPRFEPLHGRVMEADGIRLYGLDCLSGSELQEALSRVPKDVDIFCGHQLLEEVMGLSGESHMAASELPCRMNILGDYHGSPNEGRTEDGRRWWYTGSMVLCSRSEPPAKSFLVADSSASTGEIDVSRVPLLTRPFVRVDIEWEEELVEFCDVIRGRVLTLHDDAVANGIPERVAVPFVSVKYNAEVKDAHSRMVRAVGDIVEAGRLHVHFLTQSRLAAAVQPSENVVSRKLSVLDAVRLLVDEETSPELLRFVVDLDASQDPRGFIRKLKESRGVKDRVM
jgi:hypothetical protein